MELSEFQRLLNSVWRPQVDLLYEEFEVNRDLERDTHEDMTPHISKPGYIPEVEGGAVLWLRINAYQLWNNDWFQASLWPHIKSWYDQAVESAQAKRPGQEDISEEVDEYLQEMYVWIKVRCMVRDIPADGLTVEFDAYVCNDDYGRDSIDRWIRQINPHAKTDQTIGTFCETFLLEEMTEDILTDMARKQVAYLCQMRDAKLPPETTDEQLGI